MGAEGSKDGIGEDQMETLCRAMEQMQKDPGDTSSHNVRQKLESAKNSISHSFGNEPGFRRIVEELERSSASGLRGEGLGANRAIEKAIETKDEPRKLDFVLATPAEAKDWQDVLEKLAETNGLSTDDLDDETLAMADGDGVEIPTDTELEPDWESLKYPVSGWIYTKIYESKDISWGSDGSLMKKQLEEGEGEDMPQDSSKVKIKIEAATDGVAPISGFQPCFFEFVAGSGEACDALEIAVVSMKKGERAVLTCSDVGLCAGTSLGMKALKTGMVVITLQLIEFQKGSDPKSMSEAEKIAFGTTQKESGSKLFRDGRTKLALLRYKMVLDLFADIDGISQGNQGNVKELRRLCELNRAACYLQLNKYSEAQTSCDFVLKEKPQNVKALYRRAQCELQLKNFTDAIADLRHAIELDPKNKEARKLLREVQTAQKQDDEQAKGLFSKMIHDPKAKVEVKRQEATGEIADEDLPCID